MNVKRYTGANIQEIMSKVRVDLGSEAVILNQRTVRKQGWMGWFQKPVLEVMVAYEDGAEPPARPTQTAKSVYSPIPAPKMRAGDGPILPPAQPRGMIAPSPQARAAANAVAEVLNRSQPSTAAHASQRLHLAMASPQRAPAPDARPSPPQPEDEEKPAPDALPEFQPLRTHASDDELLRKVERLSEMVSHVSSNITSLSAPGALASSFTPEVGPLYLRLIDQEVTPELAFSLAKEAEEGVGDGVTAQEAMKRAIVRCLGDPEPVRGATGKQTVVLLAGPTGVGKTTTLIKLAALEAVREDRKIGIVNADTYRVGAKEQIATYAEIMEAPLSVVYEVDGMANALRAQRDRDVLFIDTAGKKPSDEKQKSDIQKIVEVCAPDYVFLVLSATTGTRACTEIIKQYGYLKRYGLIFTKLDEVPCFGVILNVVNASGMPLSYLTHGQKVPDDIRPADAGKLADALLGNGAAW